MNVIAEPVSKLDGKVTDYREYASRKPAGLYERMLYFALRECNRQVLLFVFQKEKQVKVIGSGKIAAIIYVKDDSFFKHAILFGSIGLGEAYVNGQIDSPEILDVLNWFLLNAENSPTFSASKVSKMITNLLGFSITTCQTTFLNSCLMIPWHIQVPCSKGQKTP